MNAGSGSVGAIFTNSQSFNDELQRTELSRAALSTGTADSDDLERELNELADAQELAARRAQRGRGAEGRGRRGPRGHRGPDRRVHRGPRRRRSRARSLIPEEEERRAKESYERMQREARRPRLPLASRLSSRRRNNSKRRTTRGPSPAATTPVAVATTRVAVATTRAAVATTPAGRQHPGPGGDPRRRLRPPRIVTRPAPPSTPLAASSVCPTSTPRRSPACRSTAPASRCGPGASPASACRISRGRSTPACRTCRRRSRAR